MIKSETVGKIAAALSTFQKEMPKINLDRTVSVRMKSGSTYTFKYATFSNIIETIRPLLAKNKLSFTQLTGEDGSVTTLLMHESGEYLGSVLHIQGDSTPQGIGSAITYAKRYALSAILGISADDDDDANIAQGNQFKTAKKSSQAAKKPILEKDSAAWVQAISWLENGGNTDAIKNKYSVSPEDEKLLLQAEASYIPKKVKK